MNVIDKIVRSSTAPTNTNVLWLNTEDNNFYVFDNGWKIAAPEGKYLTLGSTSTEAFRGDYGTRIYYNLIYGKINEKVFLGGTDGQVHIGDTGTGNAINIQGRINVGSNSSSVVTIGTSFGALEITREDIDPYSSQRLQLGSGTVKLSASHLLGNYLKIGSIDTTQIHIGTYPDERISIGGQAEYSKINIGNWNTGLMGTSIVPDSLSSKELYIPMGFNGKYIKEICENISIKNKATYGYGVIELNTDSSNPQLKTIFNGKIIYIGDESSNSKVSIVPNKNSNIVIGQDIFQEGHDSTQGDIFIGTGAYIPKGFQGNILSVLRPMLYTSADAPIYTPYDNGGHITFEVNDSNKNKLMVGESIGIGNYVSGAIKIGNHDSTETEDTFGWNIVIKGDTYIGKHVNIADGFDSTKVSAGIKGLETNIEITSPNDGYILNCAGDGVYVKAYSSACSEEMRISRNEILIGNDSDYIHIGANVRISSSIEIGGSSTAITFKYGNKSATLPLT